MNCIITVPRQANMSRRQNKLWSANRLRRYHNGQHPESQTGSCCLGKLLRFNYWQPFSARFFDWKQWTAYKLVFIIQCMPVNCMYTLFVIVNYAIDRNMVLTGISQNSCLYWFMMVLISFMHLAMVHWLIWWFVSNKAVSDNFKYNKTILLSKGYIWIEYSQKMGFCLHFAIFLAKVFN